MSKEIRNSIFNLPEGASSGSSWTAQLPQKLIVTPDVYTEEMDATTGWVVSGTDGTMALNTTEKYSGTGSLKITSGVGTNVDLDKEVNWDLSGGKEVSFNLRIYPHSDVATTINHIEFFVSTGTNTYTNYFTGSTNKTELVNNTWGIIFPQSGWTVGAGTPSWAAVKKIKIRMFAMSGQIAECSFDLMVAGKVMQKAVLLTFDDGHKSVYDNAYPLIKAKNMVAIPYIVSDYIGNASSMTSAQLIELNANGWDIGNHTKTHPADMSLGPQAGIEAEYEGCRLFLDGIGLTKASKHMAPNFLPTQIVVDAATHWGAITQRGSKNLYGDRYDTADFPLNIHAQAMANTSTLAQVQAMVNKAHSVNATAVLIFHRIFVTNPGADPIAWLASQLSDLIDWLESEGIQTLTIDEYYRLYSGPIHVHHK